MKPDNQVAEKKRNIIQMIREKRLWTALFLFLIVFVLTRIPWYFHYGIPYLFDDSADFNNLAQQILSGHPVFDRRTPVYPLLLVFSWLCWHNVVVVVVVQSLITLVTGCLFIYTFYRWYTRYTIPAGIAITIFTSLIVYLNFESVLMSELLYVCTTVLWACSFIAAIKQRTPIWWALSSVLFMGVILVRPSGLYLVPLGLLILVYMFVNRYPRRSLLWFTIPAVVMFLGLCTYNLIKINRFSISSQGTDMIGNVVFYLEPDSAFPAFINSAITEQVVKKFPEAEKEFIRNSWDVNAVQSLQVKNQNLMYPLLNALKEGTNGNREQYIDACSKVTWQAIKTHPQGFFKFTAIQMLHYFDGFNYKQIAAFPFLVDYKSCFGARLHNYFYDNANRSGRFYLFQTPSLDPIQTDKLLNDLDKKPVHRLSQSFSVAGNILFRNYLWLILYFAVLLLSLIKLIRNRFQYDDGFVILAICLMVILNMIFHSLVNIVMIRYSYALFWVYYLSPLFLAILMPQGWGKGLLGLRKKALQKKGVPGRASVKAEHRRKPLTGKRKP
jgi:hypothetical protein